VKSNTGASFGAAGPWEVFDRTVGFRTTERLLARRRDSAPSTKIEIQNVGGVNSSTRITFS
jgi:hypothetical protein